MVKIGIGKWVKISKKSPKKCPKCQERENYWCSKNAKKDFGYLSKVAKKEPMILQ